MKKFIILSMLVICVFRVVNKYEGTNENKLCLSLYVNQKDYMACEEMFDSQVYLHNSVLFKDVKVNDFIKINYEIKKY